MRKQNVLGVILGGGAGTRLFPLTRDRAKPAVPLAGKYRLIDIPMSNCLNSGINKIAILTQFNSVSLHRHIYRTYNRDMFTRGWVQVLAAEQTPYSDQWYQGTADAVRQQIVEIKSADSDYAIVLAGDHLYRMDYQEYIQHHIDSGADITIGVLPVDRESASAFGILKMDESGRITEFTEKPKTDEALAGFESGDNPAKPYMASMGIYVFNTSKLLHLLEKDDGTDFGHHIIPNAIGNYNVVGYPFEGYWEDIGTIRRFYEVNLDMASPLPKFNLYDPKRPIYTRPRFLPGSKVEGGTLHNVLLADGGRIQEATIRHTVVGLRSIVASGCQIQRAVLMGADFYETEADRAENRNLGQPDIGIGAGSVIESAIVDKNARLGSQVIIRGIPDRPDGDHDNWYARDGIVIVPKGAIIPDGTVI